MQYDFDIARIAVACHVGTDSKFLPVHAVRPNHGLVLTLSGKKKYVFDNGLSVQTEKNRILYLPQGHAYVVENIEDGECMAINFTTSSPLSVPPFVFKTKSHVFYQECFKAAVNAWETKPYGVRMFCKAQLCDIIAMMQKEYAGTYVSRETTKLIEPAVELIHQQYTGSGIQINELAALCGISESYFRRIFQGEFGCSPIQYVRNLRISRAKELLKSDLYSISDVAELSGFHDECYFSREFKKAVGVSPSVYNK